MQVDLGELKEIFRTVRKIETGTIKKVNKMNFARAGAFKERSTNDTKAGNLRLQPNTPATVKIQGTKHNPEYFTGKLLSEMQIKDTDLQTVDAGYFVSDTKKGSPKLTYYQIAIIQTMGYRIPLQGAKGERVRNWLARKGVFPSKDKEFLTVPPRPFLYNAHSNALTNGVDEKVVNKYMSDLWNTL